MRNYVYALILCSILMGTTAALSMTISPTYKQMDLGLSIAFTNTTSGINSSYPISYGYSINRTGYSLVNNTFTFMERGNYLISESMTNAGSYAKSQNSLIIVNGNLTAMIYPPATQAVINERQSFQANISGGTPPYIFQWYLGLNCTDAIANATSQQYSTIPLNASQIYCVRVTDNYSRQTEATVNISIFRSLYTDQGEVISVANHTALLAPTILQGNNSYMVENVTPYALFNITLCDRTYYIYEMRMTPSYANLSIDNTSYNLMPGEPQSFGNGDCQVKLLNISWVPIAQTAALSFYYLKPVTTSTTTSTSTITTASTTSINKMVLTGGGGITTPPPSALISKATGQPVNPGTIPSQGNGNGIEILGLMILAVAIILIILKLKGMI